MLMKKSKTFAFYIIFIIFCFCFLPIRSYATGDRQIMVSLGDSYSSGEGVEPFYGQNKNVIDKLKSSDWLAHRSKKSWPGKIKLPGNTHINSQLKEKKWYFRAISGAETKHFDLVSFEKKAKYKTYIPEANDFTFFIGTKNIPKECKIFDKLKDEEKFVDYVTITIGGNDVGFSNIITTAVLEPGTFTTTWLSKEINKTKSQIYNVKQNLNRVYKKIRSKTSGNTIILVVGYPRLISSQGGGPFNKEEANMININGVDYFNNNVIKKVVNKQRGRILFVDVSERFKTHEAYTADPYINPIIWTPQNQDIDSMKIPSAYSIHPNEKGTNMYAKCVQEQIDAIDNKFTGGEYEGLKWSLNSNKRTISIEKYVGDGTIVRVPQRINGYKVTHIKSMAFFRCTKLRRIVLPDSIKSIGDAAFCGCENADINIPRRVEIIRDSAFRGCGALTDIVIPTTVRYISKGCFWHCENLRRVSLPYSLKVIDRMAFSDCYNITSINIPNSVIYIGWHAFSSCVNMKIYSGNKNSINTSNVTQDANLEIISKDETEEYNDDDLDDEEFVENPEDEEPDDEEYYYDDSGDEEPDDFEDRLNEDASFWGEDVDDSFWDEDTSFWTDNENETIEEDVDSGYISDGAFAGCESIENIEISDSISNIEDNAFAGCVNLKEIKIPDSVTYIGENAFANCENLLEINIPSGVSGIKAGVFKNCKRLKEIKLPDNINTIEKSAFEGCVGLETVILPDSLLMIDDSTFKGCVNIKDIFIPSQVTYIGDEAFANCEGLTNIVVDRNNKEYDSRNDCCSIIESRNNKLILGCKNSFIPNTVVSISDKAFNNSNQGISIPKSVKEIGNNAFTPLVSPVIGYYDSYAEKFANENNLDFKPIISYRIELYDNNSLVDTLSVLSEPEDYIGNYCGETPISCPSRTKKGYKFLGWNTKQNESGTLYNKTFYKLTRNNNSVIKLYAKWQLNKYTINYKLSGGNNNTSNPTSYTVTSANIVLKKPTKTGYIFVGWYKDSNYKNRLADDTIKSGSTGNITLYAKWQLKKYKITYKLEGGKNNTDNPSTYTITTPNITLKKPTKTGYTFVGWYLDPNYKKQLKNGVIKTGSTGDIILYSKWKKKS
ncbi:Listeria/Bacterioides repeat-containing protein [Acetitomaculum ruminis DSM 5522]|uniref:Listeria/Bacterioides repeat-containing protein n=1 Tax=Acetitomaculum ruminis DSM 5522 TaxID=1120918 RepID=A0A1I0YVB6_9FIRM|nr:leucine-rich repeat protein [Acetitomaculum ruminis]SFB17284.1 Listeria/Bacterioides repeat-containing protein [Acetitomaculum ruminis DSM 5522]